MTYTAPTDDIMYQGRPDMLGFTASGTINEGQCCMAVGTLQAIAATEDVDKFIGVAVYKKTDGEKIALAGPGTIVRVVASGTVSSADDVFCGSEGKVYNAGTAANKIGVALEDADGTTSVVRVLLM